MNSFPEQLPTPQPTSALPFKCMWGNCHASFSSLNELVGHVNLDHLVNSTQNLDPESIPDIFHRNPNQQEPQSSVSCLWGECSSSYYSTNNDIEKLATHLMNDHLGFQVQYTHTNHPPLPEYTTEEGATQAAPSTLDQDLHPTIQIPGDYVEPLSPIIASDHTCTGTHACQWKDCELTFDSCDGLTAHINGIHIGSGKAHYDCFWDNCSRNGQQGFQSKQKICRHVQVHTACIFAPTLLSLLTTFLWLSSHILDTDLSNVTYVSNIFRRLRRCNNIKGGIPKKVRFQGLNI